ncbi:UNVERIFIED_CONTAM: hypothetical protein Cloal_1150 [Acetivibrio alkalicellulosi]
MAVIAKTINGKICLRTSAMVDILGITQQTLSLWDDQGCPKAARGWWSIKDVLAWKGLLPGGDTEEDQEKISLAQKKLEAEIKFKASKAEESEFKNAVLQGEYVKKEDVTDELQRFFVVLKRSMISYSRIVATEVSGYVDAITTRRIENLIKDSTMGALEQISIDGVYEPKKNIRKGR